MQDFGGFSGRYLRVDLSRGKISDATFDEKVVRKYLGGTGMGSRILYDEVPPGVEWSDPRNRMILASGPLGGTVIGGSGTFSLVTKGLCLGVSLPPRRTACSGLASDSKDIPGSSSMVRRVGGPTCISMTVQLG